MNRLYISLIAAAALAGGVWYVIHLQSSNTRLTAELSTAQASLVAEQLNRRKADEADKRNTTRQDALQTDKVANPLPAVIVYRGVRQCPTVPQGGTSAKPDEAPKADDAGAHAGDSRGLNAEVDIGPPLDQFATDAESNLIQCQELQTWLISR